MNYIPELWHNLFSITAAIKQGCEVSSKGLEMSIKKGGFEMKFDRITHTGNGFLMGVKMFPSSEVASVAAMPEGKAMSITTLHQCLGHPSEATTRATAKAMNWNLQGQLEKCEDCALAKARQKNVPKSNPKKSVTKGERLLMDISSVKDKSFGGSKYWLLIEDEATSMKWSYFLKANSEVAEKMINFIKAMQAKNKDMVKFVRCDNAGENKTSEERCKQEDLNVSFEYTAPNTICNSDSIFSKYGIPYT